MGTKLANRLKAHFAIPPSILISLAITLIALEILLRIFHPVVAFPYLEKVWLRVNKDNLIHYFTIDPDFGFRPILGTAAINEFGTHVNRYGIEKRQGIIRLLFIGDSVVSRGQMISALQQLYGNDKFEYWNAGVESYNTIQEVKFYEKYSRHIKPDHVILFFSNDDFEAPPVCFLNNENKLVVYSPDKPTIMIERWFFKYSYLYRMIVSSYLQLFYKNNGNGKIKEEIKREVKNSIGRLKNILNNENIKFTVVVFPVIDIFDHWASQEKESRREIINILQSLNIRYFDLSEVIFQLTPKFPSLIEFSMDNDRGHPQDKVALYFAAFLHEKKLLE
ncbi:MAG: hypothetical protein PHY56_05025 [Candidatus Omnitrophica bacterium]|nr:hypothetical protein [Candidatus Omnitrophota bacterium]